MNASILQRRWKWVYIHDPGDAKNLNMRPGLQFLNYSLHEFGVKNGRCDPPITLPPLLMYAIHAVVFLTKPEDFYEPERSFCYKLHHGRGRAVRR